MKNNSKYFVWVALIVLITVMLVVFQGCNFMKKRYPKTITKELVFKSADYQKLVVENPNGNVSIRKSENDSLITIKAEVTKNLTKKELDKPVDDIMLNIDTTGKTILLSESKVKGNSGFQIKWDLDFSEAASYTIYVPSGIEIEVEGSNGKVDLRDFNNNVSAELNNGSIKVKNVYGNIKLELSNGSITAELDSTKGVDFKTTNGNIKLDIGSKFSGVFELQTKNGKINYNKIEFSNVKEKKNEFKGSLGEGNEKVRLETTNGRITIDNK